MFHMGYSRFPDDFELAVMPHGSRLSALPHELAASVLEPNSSPTFRDTILGDVAIARPAVHSDDDLPSDLEIVEWALGIDREPIRG
jgi:hypothetical protein